MRHGKLDEQLSEQQTMIFLGGLGKRLGFAQPLRNLILPISWTGELEHSFERQMTLLEIRHALLEILLLLHARSSDDFEPLRRVQFAVIHGELLETQLFNKQ
jgi:hypothetical protein